MNLAEYKAEIAATKESNNGTFEARRIIVYGPPKTGKTELVGCLAAKGFKLKWFDIESGIKTLLRSDSGARSGLANIELFRIPDTQTYPVATKTIESVVKGGSRRICFDHGAVECYVCKAKGTLPKWNTINVSEFGPKDIVVVDSISQLVSSTMMFICKDQIAKGNDDYKPDWDDWRKQGFLLDRIFSTIQASNFHFIGISHEEEQKLEDGKKRLVPVGGTGNYSKTFAKYFDDIVYTDVVNGKYRAYSSVGPTVNAIVGSRAGKKLEDGTGTGGKGLEVLFE